MHECHYSPEAPQHRALLPHSNPMCVFPSSPLSSTSRFLNAAPGGSEGLENYRHSGGERERKVGRWMGLRSMICSPRSGRVFMQITGSGCVFSAETQNYHPWMESNRYKMIFRATKQFDLVETKRAHWNSMVTLPYWMRIQWVVHGPREWQKRILCWILYEPRRARRGFNFFLFFFYQFFLQNRV